MNELTAKTVRKFSQEEMQEEVKRADSEREHDEKYPAFSELRDPYKGGLPNKLPTHTETKQHRGVVVTSQNGKEYHEDRADFIMCDNVFAKEFYDLDLEEKAALLNARLEKLAKDTAKLHPGTTLTASLMWTTKDKTTGELISHVLTAQIGDSRAVLFTDENVTRLTREHSLLREHERASPEFKDFKIEKVSSPSSDEYYERDRYVIKYNNYGIATQTNHYLRTEHGGIQSSRTLGDARLRRDPPLFRSEASFSYRATPIGLNPIVVTCSDGITDLVSDKNIQECIHAAKGDYRLAAQNIARFAAHRGSPDNLAVIVTPSNSIGLGEVAFQFTADGHSGSETVDHIASDLREFPYKSEIRLSPELMAYRHFNDPDIKDILDKVEAGEIDEQTASDQLKALGKDRLVSDQKIKVLHDELNYLINEILIVNKHEKNEGPKYKLLRDFADVIKNHGFQSEEQLRNSIKNLFYLALQRNKGGLTNTTESGKAIRDLLNNPECAQLKAFLFSERGEAPVRYRDIRKLTTEIGVDRGKDRRTNEKIFSNSHKTSVYEFWISKKQTLLQSLIENSMFGELQKAIKEKNDSKPGCFSCLRIPRAKA